MAKMKKKKNRQIAVLDDMSLPQNIHLVGENDVDEKKIAYIRQSIYREIHKFASGQTTVESGGILVGNTVEEFGRTHIIIRGFVDAKFSEATPTTLKFTHETWEHCHKEIAKKFPKYKILGWIHTHPDFGIFLSEYDVFIQTNFFKDENQVAYVIDPIQNIEGFYVWRNEKIERAKGFYLFDENGSNIDFEEVIEETVAPKKSIAPLVLGGCVGVLAMICVALFMQISDLKVKLNRMDEQQQMIVDSFNQSIGYMQQQVYSLQSELDTIKLELTPVTEENPQEDTTDETGDTTGETEETSGEAEATSEANDVTSGEAEAPIEEAANNDE